MAQYKLIDVASVIRSKNSGPFELTFDVIFKDFDMYNKVKAANIFNETMFCNLYHIKPEDIINIIHFDPCKGNKSNHCSSYSIWFIRRNRCLWCTTAYAFDEDELRIIK